MTAVIEQKLRAYERKNAIRDDMTLLVALRELLAEEEEKSDCDWDAIGEMTDAILNLEGVDVDSFEASAGDAAAFRASMTEHRSANDGEHARADTAILPTIEARPRASRKLRWIIPIAAVLAALLVGGAIAATYLLDLFTMDADTYKAIPVGAVVTEDSEALEKTDSRRRIDGYEALDGARYASLLVPARLPDGWRIKSIVTDELSNASLVETLIDAGEGSAVRIKALLSLNAELDAPSERIAGFDVVVTEYDGAVQGEFTCGEDYYLIQAASRALLEQTMESMEAMR